MRLSRGLPHRMDRFALDEVTEEQLLRGRVSPLDAPPPYARVAELIRTAQTAAGLAEAGDLSVLAAITNTVRSTPVEEVTAPPRFTRIERRHPTSARHRNPAHSHSSWSRAKAQGIRFPFKVAVIAATLMLGATAAAAATGNLPNPAQDAIDDAIAKLGFSIPNSGIAPTPDQIAAGVAAVAAAKEEKQFNKCNGFLHSNGNAANSAGFNRLIADHGGTVATATAYCQGVAFVHDLLRGKSDLPHGNSDGVHGKSDLPHGNSGTNGPPAGHGKPAVTHGNAGGNGNGNN